MKFFALVFRIEAVISVVTGLVAMAAPERLLQVYVSGSIAPLATQGVRWFGAVVLPIGYSLWQATLGPERVTRVTLTAILIGDFTYSAVLVGYGVTTSDWTSGVIGTLAMNALLATSRILCLQKPERALAKRAG